MPVTDLEMVMLRAQIAGEDDVAQRAVSELMAESGDLSGLAALVHAAFVIAARRYFADGWTRADVVQYVAQLRSILNERPDLIDAVAAESEVRRALGDELASDDQAGAIAVAHLILLDSFIARLDLDDEGIEELLNQARHTASCMLNE